MSNSCKRGHENPERYKGGNCKLCQRLRQAEDYQKRRDYLIQTNKIRQVVVKAEMVALKGGKCADCGFSDDNRPEVFDFDHLPGTVKLTKVSKMKSWSRKRWMAELEKCELVCANCHRTRTRNRALQENSRNVLKTLALY